MNDWRNTIGNFYHKNIFDEKYIYRLIQYEGSVTILVD